MSIMAHGTTMAAAAAAAPTTTTTTTTTITHSNTFRRQQQQQQRPQSRYPRVHDSPTSSPFSSHSSHAPSLPPAAAALLTLSPALRFELLWHGVRAVWARVVAVAAVSSSSRGAGGRVLVGGS
ncbi:hypothetical protein IWX49DRAFT_301795 [Phyllosticta citricarpa]|uniref:Uncharacterized protein n=1 Tax=Phyllosticta paracitricarpa TaxID=2016321 RepID=A0ABR1NDF2_9PEZI